MSESFSTLRQAQAGHAERREKAVRTIQWERAPEITSRADCERLNKDPNSKYEYRWVEK